MLLAAGAASAQERIASVRVYANPPGAWFKVDGQTFQAPATFLWPEGSKHVLEADSVQDRSGTRTRYAFKKWYANDKELSQGPVTVVTADPAIQSFHVDYGQFFLLQLRFFRCPEPPCAAGAGSIYLNIPPNKTDVDVDLWVEAGKQVKLEAAPAPGYTFLGWLDDPGGEITGFLDAFNMVGPRTVTPRFGVARRVQLETSPAGLQIMADRAVVYTPITLDWGWDTTHSLGPVTPQFDLSGKLWVFKGWADGGPALRAYKVPSGGQDARLTAEYVPGARMTFLTSPPGLKLQVDGRENWYGSYSFSWGVGETHRFSAPLEQTDAQGRKWMFTGWSNGGVAEQEITVTEADAANGGARLTAQYEALGRITVQSQVSGITVSVDGAPCKTPCTLDRASGTQVILAAPASVPYGDGARYDFQGWDDGAAAERTVTFDTGAHTVTAAYKLMNRLTTAADPAEGAVWRCEPQSSDGYYDTQSQVALTVESRPGFRFRRFEGDLNSNFSSGVVAMSAPRYVRAVFERVPYIAPAGVRNAAGETPVAAVAPGSVISIYGANLAAATETGPESPLAQSLSGVTVKFGDRLLPLFFVSPEQINAQLSSDVEPGQYTLAVKPDGKTEVKAEFSVARNAPGLFQVLADGETYAVAAHADGSAVTVESPARAGETITIYATGFGPCDRRPPDGFAVPAAPVYKSADPVQIVAGETTIEAAWAGAAVGRVGVNALRLRVGPELGTGTVKLKVLVNGQESNTVTLPVE